MKHAVVVSLSVLLLAGCCCNPCCPPTEVAKAPAPDTSVEGMPPPVPVVRPERMPPPATADTVGQVLQKKRLKGLKWEDATLEQAAMYLRTITGVNFYVSPKALERNIKISLEMDDVSVATVLDIITEQNELKWKVKDGVVRIFDPTEEPLAVAMRLRYYDVKDIVALDERAGETLLAQVQKRVEPGRWKGSGRALEVQNGILIARAEAPVLSEIDAALTEIRRQVEKTAPVVVQIHAVADIVSDLQRVAKGSAYSASAASLANAIRHVVRPQHWVGDKAIKAQGRGALVVKANPMVQDAVNDYLTTLRQMSVGRSDTPKIYDVGAAVDALPEDMPELTAHELVGPYVHVERPPTRQRVVVGAIQGAIRETELIEDYAFVAAVGDRHVLVFAGPQVHAKVSDWRKGAVSAFRGYFRQRSD